MFKKFSISVFILIFFTAQLIVPINIAQASSAQTITFGNTITGNITSTSEEDTYQIVLPKAGKIDVNLNSSIYEVNVGLEDANGNSILYEDLCYGSLQSPKTWSPSIDLEAGTYYLKVYKVGENTGAYDLKVNFTLANNNDIEPNNDTLTAQKLTLNSDPITGYLSWNDELDVYKVTLPTAGKVAVKFTTPIKNVSLALKDSSDNTIVCESLLDGSAQNPKTWSPSADLEAGTYYISVSKYDQSTGVYNLNVNFTAANNNDIEPNNDILTAQSLVLNGSLFTGYLSLSDDVDMYKINLLKPGKIDVNFTTSINNVNVELQDINENPIFDENLNGGSQQSPKALSQSVDLEAGTYYLKVYKYGENTGVYNLKANYTAANNSDVEPNNDTSTAQPLTLNSNPITGYITWKDEQDVYKIQLNKAGKININLLSYINNLSVDLTDSNGNKIFCENLYDGSVQSPKTWAPSVDLEAGTYYLKVVKYLNDTGIYSVKVNYTSANNNDVEPNDENLTAQLLTLNSNPITGYISWNDDQDMYKITLDKAGKVYLNMNSMINEVNAYLLNSNGDEILFENLKNGSVQTPKVWSPSVDLEAGTYYLKVRRVCDDTGIYNVKVNFNAANNNELEPNNDTFNAQPLTLNSIPITGFLSWNDDQDIYKIELAKATKIYINMTSMIYDTDFDLKDSQGATILYQGVNYGSEQTPKIWSSSVTLDEGTYYLKVSRYGSNTGKYTLGITTFGQPIAAAPVSDAYNSLRIIWGALPGASGYEVYRSTSSTGTYSLVGTTASTSFTNTSLIAGQTYYYTVRAYSLIGTVKVYSSFSTAVSGKPVPTTPASVTTASTSYNSIKTAWGAVAGASGYEVYRATTSTGTYSLVGTVTSTSFINTGVITGQTYYYKVRAYTVVGTTKIYSNYSVVVNGKTILAAPASVSAVSSSYSSIKTTWGAVAGASGYEVYRAATSTGAYSLVGTTATTSFINTGVIAGQAYYYKMRAYILVGNTKVYGNYSAVVSGKSIQAAPASLSAVSASYNSIKTTWGALAGASYYEVYRATSSTGPYSLVGTTAATSFVNTGLIAGKVYYYKVRAYTTVGTTKIYSNYSTIVSMKPVPAAPASVAAVALPKKSIKTTWGAVAGAKSYEIYRATSIAGTYSLISTTASTSFTNTGLIVGQTYYYKMRAYTLVGTTKIYSNYSTIVRAKAIP